MRNLPSPVAAVCPVSGGLTNRSVMTAWVIIFLMRLLSIQEIEAREMGEERTHEVSFKASVTELADVISGWYGKKGYRVERRSLDMGRVVITVVKEASRFDIHLTPDSPIGVLTTWGRPLEDPVVAPLIQEIRSYLSEPGFEDLPLQEIPDPVLQKKGAVLCIRSSMATDANRFSGFLIHPSGRILSTAHGLKGITKVTLFYHDGRQASGRVVRIDFMRDLALIQEAHAARDQSSITLSEGRELPEMGERLYGAGCAGEQGITFYSGIMEGTPVMVNGEVLFQVHMPIHPGNSGSPVFDRKGRLIGMVKARFKGSDSIGFLIPLKILTEFLEEELR